MDEDRLNYERGVQEIVASLAPTQARLRRMAGALQELRLAAQEDPRPGSPREADETTGSFPVAGFDGVWEVRPLVAQHDNVVLAIYAIGQELEAIARSLDALPLAYADVVLARAIMETAARAWWMLEPGLTTFDRAGRHVTERFYDLHQGVRVFRDAPVPPGARRLDPRGEFIQAEADLKAAAERAGFTVEGGRRRHPYHVDGHQRPTSTKLLEELYDVAGLGRVAYHEASAIVHGSPVGLSRTVGTARADGRTAMTGSDPDRTRLEVGVAMLATLELADRLIDHDSLETTRAGLAWSGISQTVVDEHLAELGRVFGHRR